MYNCKVFDLDEWKDVFVISWDGEGCEWVMFGRLGEEFYFEDIEISVFVRYRWGWRVSNWIFIFVV